MADYYYYKNDQDVLNCCTKYLARSNPDARHKYGPPGSDAPRDRIAEAWRSPVIGTYGGGTPAVYVPADFPNYNEVTFIYAGADAQSPVSVSIVGTFATMQPGSFSLIRPGNLHALFNVTDEDLTLLMFDGYD
jgi:hypothetical protein